MYCMRSSLSQESWKWGQLMWNTVDRKQNSICVITNMDITYRDYISHLCWQLGVHFSFCFSRCVCVISATSPGSWVQLTRLLLWRLQTTPLDHTVVSHSALSKVLKRSHLTHTHTQAFFSKNLPPFLHTLNTSGQAIYKPFSQHHSINKANTNGIHREREREIHNTSVARRQWISS